MTAFVNGHIEPAVEFPYDEIDRNERGNPINAELEGERENDSTTLGKIFTFLITYGGTNPQQFFISANVLSFAMGTHPNQAAGGVAIALGLKMNKAAWFRRVNNMRRILIARGQILPKIAGEWSESARKSIKQKTTKHHNERINRISQASVNGCERNSLFNRAVEASGIAD